MKKILYIIFLVLSMIGAATAQTQAKKVPESQSSKNDLNISNVLEFKPNVRVLNHIGYITYFDLDLRQPLKTYYTLTVQHAKSLKFKRTTFHQDILLCKTCQATYADLNNYSKTFDRGHFTPDKDMCWSKRSEREAMVFTNQSFQDKKLNETVWLAIEDFIRKEVIKQNKSAQVWTGVVYSQATISKLNVPKYFWKLVQIGDMQKAWFILNAIPESKDISAYEIKYDDLMKSFDKYNISLR